MNVLQCNSCAHFQRRCWSHIHVPNNYHPIGMTHAYGFCKKCGKRCAEVKKRECAKEKEQ